MRGEQLNGSPDHHPDRQPFRCHGSVSLGATPTLAGIRFDMPVPPLLPEDLRLAPVRSSCSEAFAPARTCSVDTGVRELEADGRTLAMTPAGREKRRRNSARHFEPESRSRRTRDRYGFDGSTGSDSPHGCVCSADAPWRGASRSWRCRIPWPGVVSASIPAGMEGLYRPRGEWPRWCTGGSNQPGYRELLHAEAA